MPRRVTVGSPLTCALGKRIEVERKRRGISLREVARAIGQKETMVCRWESGGGRPSMEDMLALSALFNRSIHWLVVGQAFQPAQTLKVAA